ncbi:MAG TPA: M56 family metallopeptidase [Allosphingosinicella sp.]|nr:M56 family metallopeptidase [Allosphingosinicella sp.]
MISWLVANMAWASLFMLVVLALRRPVARAFGAGSAYALWLLPALRLVMPPLPSLAPDIAAPLPVETLVVWAGDAAAPLPPAAGPASWLPLLLAIWALGAVVLLGWQWLAYRRFAGALGRSARSLGAHRGLPVWESAAAVGPVALGFLDRRIVVPADFGIRYSGEERRLALDHEAVHHRRGDIWWNLAGLLILALNWFNPIAWLAFRAFRADQELACDAAVAAAASAAARHDYARALVKSASRPGLIAACPLNHADQLKRRLKMMKHHRRSRARMLGGAAIVLTLAGLSLAVGAPGFAQPDAPKQDQAQPREERREEHRVIIRTDHDGPGAAEHRDHAEHREHSRRVIVMSHRGDGHGDHADHLRRFELHRDGGHGAEIVIPDCQGGQADEVNEGGDHDRTRIVLCSRGAATPAQRAERLARVRDRLANDDELSAEQKARVTAALDREIARLRGQ